MSRDASGLDTFGLGALLKEGSTIIYSAEMYSRDIGRISDLVSARFREAKIDELKLRAILLYGVFESYAAQGKAMGGMAPSLPASVECGMDEDRFAISIAFHWSEASAPRFDGIAERVGDGVTGDTFEDLLVQLKVHCSRLLVRYHSETRRVEIACVVDRNGTRRVPSLELIEVFGDYPVKHTYIEMGDLPAADLLGRANASPAATAEAARLHAPDIEEELVRLIGGAATDEEEAIRVRGETIAAEVQATIVKAAITDEPADSRPLRREAAYKGQIQALLNKIRGMEEDYDKLRSTVMSRKVVHGAAAAAAAPNITVVRGAPEAPAPETTVVIPSAAPAQPEAEGWGMGFISKIFGFGAKNEAEPVAEADTALKADAAKISDGSAGSEPASAPIDESVAEEAEGEAEELPQIQSLRDMAVQDTGQRLTGVFQEISASVDSDRSKKWIDGIMSEILQEKAQLAQLSKELGQQVRHKEAEFRGRENYYRREIARQEELIRQKEAQVGRKSDQIVQLNQSLEKGRSSGSASEEQQLKIKLSNAQRFAQMKDEESKTQADKIKELESRLMVAQSKAKPSNDSQLQSKLIAAEKKVEEYKKVNLKILENMNQARDKSADPEVKDMKRKLEMAERSAIEARKALEKSSIKVRELQEMERKLKQELGKIQEETQRMKKVAARGGPQADPSDSSGSNAA